jgi:hypothetical protein
VELIKVGQTPGTIFYRLEGQPPVRAGVAHFHVRAHGVHACVTGIEGAVDAEAEGNALGEFLPEFRVRAGREDDLADIFGNNRLTYCAAASCDCDLPVHVVRMQDGRQAVTPRVLIFDLI